MASSNDSESGADQRIVINDAYGSFKHNASLAMLVVAPVLIAIPPRKLDLYTFSLVGAFVMSANQLTVERTGKGLVSQFSYGNVPPRAHELQMRLVEEKSKRRLLEERSRVPDEVANRRVGVRGAIENQTKEVWMGTETEGWKERRLREEQEKLNKGEGYGGMIMDQIWEVWNWGEKKSQALKVTDEKELQQRKQEKDG